MKHKDGLILQGCGGDIQEWADGINERLTQEDILLEGTKFRNVRSFFYEGLTNNYRSHNFTRTNKCSVKTCTLDVGPI